MTRLRRSRLLQIRRGLVLPLAALVGAAVAVPAMLPGAAQAGASATVSATVVLRTAGSAQALAETGNLPRSARLARLSATMPSAATEAAVLSQARSLGVTLDDVTPWSLAVHGTPASLRGLAAADGVASVVLAGGPAPAAARAVPLTGAQLRSGYDTSSAAPPATGIKPIVATIQFGPWDSTELSGYVTNANLVTASQDNPHPVKLPVPPAGEYTAISVDGSATTPGPGGFGGSAEVALDQESLYATNPFALQRAYFAQGSAAGLVAALNRVAVDAQNMPGLVALSISWTWCETNFSDLLDAHNALANVVAAGVTVFAASGDDGKFCNGTTTSGDAYPASDPLALAVGGTSLDLAGPNETGWVVADTSRLSGVFGSGGGISKVFPPPSWQVVASGASGAREVPDISASASADTGFYSWHDAGDGTGVGFQLSDGTSLSTPVSAGLYTAELGSRGAVNGGLGDLHSALYTAPAGTFRDITSSPSLFGQFRAAAGYDMVTGLGAPMWGKVVDRLLTQPVISVPATLKTRVVPVTVTAPAGQTFIAWSTGYGNPPATCGTSAGGKPTAQPVIVPSDGSYRIWAVGYVGDQHCFIVSTTTVVNTGATPPPTTSPPTTTAPVVTTTPPVVTTTSPAPPTTAPPVVTITPVAQPTPVTTTRPVIAPTAPVTPLSDVTPPSVSLSARQTSLGTAAVSYTWQATDGTGSGVGAVAATVFRDGKPIWTAPVKATASLTLTAVAGHTYRMGIVATDIAGNTAGFASNSVRLPYDDRSFKVSKGWARSSSHAAFDGSYVRSARPGASASITALGRTFSLLTSTGPADGIVAVYVDGKHVRDLSLYSKSTRTDVAVVLARFSSAKSHRITLLVKGKRAAQGKGMAVVVDGLLAL